MTLGELRQTLARYLGLDTTAADGLVAFWDRDLLNEAMRAINIELIIPRVSAVVSRDALETDPTVNIPDGTDVLQVVAPPDRLVPIVDSEDYAPSEEYLPMQASSGLVAVVSNNPLAVTFMKPTLEEWPESVRVVYQKKFQPMVNETDQPWDGLYEEYHVLIPMRAAMEALLVLDPGEPETPLRYRGIAAQYDKLRERFAESIDRGLALLNNPMTALINRRKRRW